MEGNTFLYLNQSDIETNNDRAGRPLDGTQDGNASCLHL